VTLERVRTLLDEELERHSGPGAWGDAAGLLDALVSAKDFPEFLTLTAYQKVVSRES
jgi:hypothetical protein